MSRRNWRANPTGWAREIERLEREASASEAEVSGAAEAERDAQEAVAVAARALADAGEGFAAAREARAGAVARAEAQEARRFELCRECGEKFECPPPLLPGKFGFDAAALDPAETERETFERLTAERERIGPVNLVAESELAELEASRASGAAERDELQEAINRLRGSIGSLNREGRVRLLAAFEQVDAPFPEPVHHFIRRRPGASRTGRERRSAGGGSRDHGPAAGQAPQPR